MQLPPVHPGRWSGRLVKTVGEPRHAGSRWLAREDKI